MDRAEYFKEYRRKNREKLLAYSKEKYQEDRKDRLTKAKEYYIINKAMILFNARLAHTDKSGHVHDIWKSTRKYAKEWKIPFEDWDTFKNWAMMDESYEVAYNTWKEADFDKKFSPVVIRGVKKHGFVVSNLKWDYRDKYSWWSQELKEFKKSEAVDEEKRAIANKRTKEWQKEKRKEWLKKKNGG